MEPVSRNIADILVSEKVLSEEQLSKVKLESANTGRSTEEIIAAERLATEEELARAKAKVWGVPFVNLATQGISPQALTFIPEPVARRYSLIPFDFAKETKSLNVAMTDPSNLQILEFIGQKSGCKIKPYLALALDIQEAIEEQYVQTLPHEVTAALKEVAPTPVKPIDIKKIGEIIREAPVAKIVSTLLEYAIKSRASDVHVEPEEDKTRVRYRIDGILHERLTLPLAVHDALISRIKILSGMKIDERRIPQDGRFNFRLGEEEVDLRVSSLPTVHGEKIVMRLLKKTGGVPTLFDLGLRGLALKNLETAMLRPHGIIIVCGPTGSGKTTTLYSVLSKINTTKINIITLEDPVEYQIPGVNQVQVNPVAGLTFASGLRSFLRQDPNVILVGEIRDSETTGLAIHAALTGHLVFSTLHTNDASGAPPRLLDLGAEAFLLASSLNCVVGQRICRRICPACKEFYEPPSEIGEDIKNVLGKLFPKKEKESKLKLYRGSGCDECNKTGYLGRIGIFEVLPVSEKIARLILEHSTAGEIEKQAKEEGMVTMKQDGYLKALEGITSLEEVLRVAQD